MLDGVYEKTNKKYFLCLLILPILSIFVRFFGVFFSSKNFDFFRLVILDFGTGLYMKDKPNFNKRAGKDKSNLLYCPMALHFA